MMEAEKLRVATLHTAQALQPAFSIGLSDQNGWKQEPDGFVSLWCLFWVLFFLDKRIHYKCGTPHRLQSADINVGQSPPRGENEIEDENLELLERMISCSQLWTPVWAELLSPNAPTIRQWSQVQIADARVVLEYQSLPQKLLWKSDKMQDYIGAGVKESRMRQKLQVFPLNIEFHLPFNSLADVLRSGISLYG